MRSPIELRVCEDQIATNPIDNGHVHKMVVEKTVPLLGFHNQTNIGLI